MIAIEAKLDALMNKLGNQERRMHSTHEVGTVEGNEQKSSADEGLAHEDPYQVEEAQFVNGHRSHNFKPNFNLPTHYTSTEEPLEFLIWMWSTARSKTRVEFSTTVCSTWVPRTVATKESESRKSRTKEISIL